MSHPKAFDALGMLCTLTMHGSDGDRSLRLAITEMRMDSPQPIYCDGTLEPVGFVTRARRTFRFTAIEIPQSPEPPPKQEKRRRAKPAAMEKD